MASDVSLEWCGGFFEGEGNAIVRKYQGKTGKKPYAALQLAQVNREPLDAFCKALGAGTVRGPYGPYRTNQKAYYQWSVQGKATLPAARRLLPYLLNKGEQVLSVIEEMDIFYDSQ